MRNELKERDTEESYTTSHQNRQTTISCKLLDGWESLLDRLQVSIGLLQCFGGRSRHKGIVNQSEALKFLFKINNPFLKVLLIMD